MQQQRSNFTLPEDVLFGVDSQTNLYRIYEALLNGRVLTALDGIVRFRTMYLPKYISVLRNRYNIPVSTRWIQLESGKYCKEYYLE
jgi:subtilase family serine protease